MASDPQEPVLDPVVELVSDEQRYVISVAGKRVGFARYTDAGGQRVFLHTEIDEEFSGRGLAGALISFALADVRGRHRRVVSLCPYVSRYLRRHREFDDIRDLATPRQIAELTSAT